jgi:hypothetical protein
MTDSMMAYCGLSCDECPAYLAYKNDDEKLRKEAATKWGSPDFPVDPSDVNCTGCKADSEPTFKFCSTCTVKACASKRGVETCAHCDDYGCDVLEEWLSHSGDELRQKLDNMRAAL